jgi:adenylate cyclase
MFKKLLDYRLAAIVGAILATGTGAFLLVLSTTLGLGDWFISRSYDLPFVWRSDIPIDSVVVVYMDELSHDRLGQPYFGGWDRAKTHAQLLRRMREEKAQAVIFDIVFSDQIDSQDSVFADALRAFPKVVLAADKVGDLADSQFQLANDTLMDALTESDIKRGIDPLQAYARHAGSAQLLHENDISVRRHTSLQDKDDRIMPLSWVAAKLVDAPSTSDATLLRRSRWLNYYGPPYHIPSVSYWKVLTTNALPQGYFKDKIVFVGASTLTKISGERKDAYRSIYPIRSDNDKLYPGVEIQATMFLNLLRGDYLLRLNREELPIILFLGVIFGAGLALLRPVLAGWTTMLSLLGVAYLDYALLVYTHQWFPWLIVAFQILLAGSWSIFFNSAKLYLHKRLLMQSVGMYVSPALARQIVRDEKEMLERDASEKALSIMFTDIENFTKMTEGMPADQLKHLMNQYFEEAVAKCVYPVGGTVVKFIGDAIFAIWNAPLDQQNHQELACRGAIALRDQITGFEFHKPGMEVRTRIGLHSGLASVGNFGSSNRVDYTAFGENINLTSRMEGLNKYLGTSILATGDIIEPVKDKFVARYLGRFQLKGFAKAVNVYELIGTPETDHPSKSVLGDFATALEHFKNREFDAAEACLKNVLQKLPGDGPASFYLKIIQELRVESPPSSWTGEIELKEK